MSRAGPPARFLGHRDPSSGASCCARRAPLRVSLAAQAAGTGIPGWGGVPAARASPQHYSGRGAGDGRLWGSRSRHARLVPSEAQAVSVPPRVAAVRGGSPSAPPRSCGSRGYIADCLGETGHGPIEQVSSPRALRGHRIGHASSWSTRSSMEATGRMLRPASRAMPAGPLSSSAWCMSRSMRADHARIFATRRPRKRRATESALMPAPAGRCARDGR